MNLQLQHLLNIAKPEEPMLDNHETNPEDDEETQSVFEEDEPSV